MNSTEAAELRALDRKLTDGLNLVHAEFAALREERREDRKELRAEIAKVDERAAQRDERAAQRTTDLETTLRAAITKVDDRVAGLETAIRELTSKVSTSLERGSGTRRLALMFAVGFVMLVTGAVIRPVLARAVSSLLGG